MRAPQVAPDRANRTSVHCARLFHQVIHCASSDGDDLGPTCPTRNAGVISFGRRPGDK